MRGISKPSGLVLVVAVWRLTQRGHSCLIGAVKQFLSYKIKNKSIIINDLHHCRLNISVTPVIPPLRPTAMMTSSPSRFSRSRSSFHASSPCSSPFILFTLRVFEASCGSLLSRLTSTHGSHPGLLLHHVTATSRGQDGVCVQQDVCSAVYMCESVCEDLRLPEPAALWLTSTIKAASEHRSVFIPVKCQKFLSSSLAPGFFRCVT